MYDKTNYPKGVCLMNYDRIILELLDRVKSLEEQVEEIKSELYENDDSEAQENEQGTFSRKDGRQKVMDLIKEKFPDYAVSKAPRNQGSGIIVNTTNKTIVIKYYHSRTYKKNSGVEHGWHSVDLDEIIGKIFDLCIFSVIDPKGILNYLIYEPDELGKYADTHRSGRTILDAPISNILHLYFEIKDGKAMEIREDPVDVSDHLNNWNRLK
jgi:hypothetical protein